VVASTAGTPYLAFRPLLADYVLSMPRGAQVVYPKDAAQIVMWGTSARCPGAGGRSRSGALSCSLLRAVGESGSVTSYEVRQDHAEHAVRNVERFFGGTPANWIFRMGDVAEFDGESTGWCWTCSRHGGAALGHRCADARRSAHRLRRDHHAVVQITESLREQQCWTEPQAWETLLRPWHVVGLRYGLSTA